MYRLEARTHKSTRLFFRVVGSVTALIGVVFLVVGMVNFFSVSSNDSATPDLFWCFFVGIPVLFVGVAMSLFGYLGAIARYEATEVAPVAADTINYVGENAQPGIKAVAKAVTEGIIEAKKQERDAGRF